MKNGRCCVVGNICQVIIVVENLFLVVRLKFKNIIFILLPDIFVFFISLFTNSGKK